MNVLMNLREFESKHDQEEQYKLTEEKKDKDKGLVQNELEF